MAINPLLLNVKPISEITTVDNPTDGHLLFYDGSDELKKTNVSDFYNAMQSAYLGIATTTTTPPTTGAYWYRVTTAGTYMGVTVTVEDFKDANGNYYDVTIEVKDGVAEKKKREIPALLVNTDIFPYLNTPVSEKQRQVVQSIKELLIHNYDSNYNYYLIEFSLKFDASASGWSDSENVIKIKRIHKTTGQADIWKLREPNSDPVDRLPTYLKFEDKFSVIVDWSQFPEGERLDVDEAEAYLLNLSVGNANYAPIIGQKNIVTETNLGKNVYYGNGVSSATGEYNMSIGKEAMQSIVGGGYNLAIGYRAMKSHQNGGGNIAIGMDALLNSTDVIDVTVVGWEAGKEMLTGVGDTGVGRRSLQKSLHANANTAFGDSTLYSLMSTTTNGVMGNVAMGYTAGEYCETIKNTILIGLACARNVKGGKGSVVIGSQAMLNRSIDSNNNVAIGENTMLSAGGNENVVVGSYTMSDNGGNENVVLGYNAGNSLTTGFRNVIVGNSAQSGATNVSDSVIVGNNAKATKSNQVVIGTVTQTEFVICGVTFTAAQLLALKNLVNP